MAFCYKQFCLMYCRSDDICTTLLQILGNYNIYLLTVCLINTQLEKIATTHTIHINKHDWFLYITYILYAFYYDIKLQQ